MINKDKIFDSQMKDEKLYENIKIKLADYVINSMDDMDITTLTRL